jgi:hypothetical protein
MIAGLARRVARRLADIGVIGRFAIDFVVARTDSARWTPFAVELNLRIGGTTHPYQTLAHLVGGHYDSESASFITAGGRPRHYVATDYLLDPRLRALGTKGVLSILSRGELRFDRRRRLGTVFHMLSSLDELGRAGITAISDSPEKASALYDHAQAVLIDHAMARRPDSRREHLPHAARLPLRRPLAEGRAV